MSNVLFDIPKKNTLKPIPSAKRTHIALQTIAVKFYDINRMHILPARTNALWAAMYVLSLRGRISLAILSDLFCTRTTTVHRVAWCPIDRNIVAMWRFGSILSTFREFVIVFRFWRNFPYPPPLSAVSQWSRGSTPNICFIYLRVGWQG